MRLTEEEKGMLAGEYGEGYIYLIKKAFWDKEKQYDPDGLDNELEIYGFPEEFTCEQESCYTWQGQGKNKAGLEWLRNSGIKEVKLTHKSQNIHGTYRVIQSNICQ